MVMKMGNTKCVCLCKGWFLHISADINVRCQCLQTHARIVGATLITVRASLGAKRPFFLALAALSVKRCFTDKEVSAEKKLPLEKRLERSQSHLLFQNECGNICLSLGVMRG